LMFANQQYAGEGGAGLGHAARRLRLGGVEVKGLS
jgi:hypothetical protein